MIVAIMVLAFAAGTIAGLAAGIASGSVIIGLVAYGLTGAIATLLCAIACTSRQPRKADELSEAHYLPAE